MNQPPQSLLDSLNILVESRLISSEQLAAVIQQHNVSGQKIGDILIGLRLIHPQVLLGFFQTQNNIPIEQLISIPPDSIAEAETDKLGNTPSISEALSQPVAPTINTQPTPTQAVAHPVATGPTIHSAPTAPNIATQPVAPFVAVHTTAPGMVTPPPAKEPALATPPPSPSIAARPIAPTMVTQPTAPIIPPSPINAPTTIESSNAQQKDIDPALKKNATSTVGNNISDSLKKIKLGDLLVKNNVISIKQLNDALKEQKNTGKKLGHTLISMGLLEEQELISFLSQQLNIPYIDLSSRKLDKSVVLNLSENIARRYRALLLENNDNHALVAMSDPTNIYAHDQISNYLKKRINIAFVKEAEILRLIDKFYRVSGNNSIANLAEELDEQLSSNDANNLTLEELLQGEEASETPVFKLLQSLFGEAVDMGASDVHIEPDENRLRLRKRVDGVLIEKTMNETRIGPALVQRLKILSKLDIAEKRLPQDGRFQINVNQHRLDVRVSTMPIQHGEAIVMRILDHSSGPKTLDQLGMPTDIMSSMRQLINQPHGLILVTGPTGSGKTTTLYSCLHELNTPERKIITVEDPIENQMPRINQVQINTKIDLTFSRVLRTALRQDPDVLLVGEMRDLETTEIGIRAAMTGHLVMSTLHTNSAVATIARLNDIGAKGYLLATAISGILAQRLVRRVCQYCSQPYPLTDSHLKWLDALFPGITNQELNFRYGQGCSQCNHSGSAGRIGAYELLTLNNEAKAALREGNIQVFTETVNQQQNYFTLSQHAAQMAVQGIISLDEVIRITSD